MKTLLASHGPRLAILLASLVGLAIAGWLLGATGIGVVLAVVGRLGVGGLLLYVGYSLIVVLLLGAAWASAAPPLGIRRTILLFSWARLVREAASDILPFSQVGGLMVGVRVLLVRGLSSPLIYASVVVDLTTEMAGQIVFTIFGIAGFVMLRTGGAENAALLTPILIGTSVMVILTAAFFAVQRWAFGSVDALVGRVLPVAAGSIGGVGIELKRIYSAHDRVVMALMFNLAAWIAAAAGASIALRLMDLHLPLMTVLVIESLIFVLRSVAFFIPGGIGVQEAAYVLIGPMLGLPAEAALALSLAKRARDLAIGLPALIAWQLSEARTIGRWLRPHAPAVGMTSPTARDRGYGGPGDKENR